MRLAVIAIAVAFGLTGCNFDAVAVPDPGPPAGDENGVGDDALCSGCGDTPAGDSPGAGDPTAGDTCTGSPCGDPTGGDTCTGNGCGDPTGGDTCTGTGCGDPAGGDTCTGTGCMGDGKGDEGDPGKGDPGPGPCPPTPPASTSDCWPLGLICEYGTDPRPGCRTRSTCGGTGQWSTMTPFCTPIGSSECKSTVVEMHGLDCTTVGESCLIGETLCQCLPCLPSSPVCGGDPVWGCYADPSEPGCPQLVPNLGTACSPDSLLCTYDCATQRYCANYFWQDGGNVCPRSRRAAKRDIEYLAPDQIDALARQVLGIDLATYQYRDPRHGSGDKLGFIIDDQPTLPALTQGGQRVDLYAFSSMLLAALKVQAQQLEALQQQVESLEARIDAATPATAPVCAP